MDLSTLSGMHDIVPDDDVPYFRQSRRWLPLLARFEGLVARYGFEYIEMPEVERTELFRRTSGETSDIVLKEMYTWDQNGRDVCLRPEGSAAVCRAVLSSGILGKTRPLKLWYRSPMFRHERPQLGRYRRHVQLGVETVGAAEAQADAEVITLLQSFYEASGVSGFTLHLNTVGDDTCRPAYASAIRAAAAGREHLWCENCQERFATNPLRILDCKVEKCRELNRSLPSIYDYLCEPCAEHFAEVKSQLDQVGVAYIQDPMLVRGLDYYTRTAFEVVLDEAVGPMGTLSGGGRYDGLYRLVGDVDVPAVGFGIGIERLLVALEHQHVAGTDYSRADVYVAVTEPALQEYCLAVATRLREQGYRTVFEFGVAKLSRQLSRAASSGARLCVILGTDEWARGEVRIKDLASRDEWDVALAHLESAVAAALAPTAPTDPTAPADSTAPTRPTRS